MSCFMNRLHVCFRGKYGLSNRIRALSGYYAISKIMGLTLSYEWYKDESCLGDFGDAFQEFDDIYLAPDFMINSPHKEGVYFVSSNTSPVTCGSHPDAIFTNFSNYIDNDLVNFNNYLKEFYERLRPSNSVMMFCSTLSLSNVGSQGLLGIHVRRTDMVDHAIRLGLEPPDDNVLISEVEKYLKYNQKTKIFVAADNPNSINMLRAIYGDRIIAFDINWDLQKEHAANDSKIQARMTTLVESVADLYILSKCDYIIGTKLSSFSTFAALWGNIKYTRV